jgi:hypothetical protein
MRSGKHIDYRAVKNDIPRWARSTGDVEGNPFLLDFPDYFNQHGGRCGIYIINRFGIQDYTLQATSLFFDKPPQLFLKIIFISKEEL